MLIHGFPISAKLPEDLGIGERFWYWQGASGRNYIHSIYAADACPPSPGAVYVAVRHVNGERSAIKIGRFPSFWDGSTGNRFARLGADEIHVHLLARNDQAADAVLHDLQDAVAEIPAAKTMPHGFNEADQPALAFA